MRIAHSLASPVSDMTHAVDREQSRFGVRWEFSPTVNQKIVMVRAGSYVPLFGDSLTRSGFVSTRPGGVSRPMTFARGVLYPGCIWQ